MTSKINLNLADIEKDLKEYFKNNTSFTDYDFEGGPLGELVRVLAYNQFNIQNANTFSYLEKFIKYSVNYDNVAQLSQELGYTPRSLRGARTSLNIKVINLPLTDTSYTLKAGTVFTSTLNNQTISFTTKEDYTIPVTPGTGISDSIDIDIYQGTYREYTKIARTSEDIFTIPDENVDTSTLKIFVAEHNQSNVFEEYTLFKDFIASSEDVDGSISNNLVYFLQYFNNKYEFYFGEDVLGKGIKPGNVVKFSYVVPTDDNANNIKSFSNNNANIVINLVNSPTWGFSEKESISEIKLNAVNSYIQQDRLLTSEDYINAIRTNFSDIEFINSWGGETNDPILLNYQLISIKPIGSDALSKEQKDAIKQILKPRMLPGVNIYFVDPTISYITTHTEYTLKNNNVNVASQNNDVKTTVSDYISDLTQSKSNALFSLSKIDAEVLKSSSNIKTSNTKFLISFKYTKKPSDPILLINEKRVFDIALDVNNFENVVYSNTFIIDGKSYLIKDSGENSPNSSLRDLNLYQLYTVNNSQGEITTVLKKISTIGSVDTKKGIIDFNNFKTTVEEIKIFLRPLDRDIQMKKNVILLYDSTNSTATLKN